MDELKKQLNDQPLEAAVKLVDGTAYVDKLKYPALKVDMLIKLVGIEPRPKDEIRQFVEKAGYQFACYFQSEGVLVFRIPKDAM